MPGRSVSPNGVPVGDVVLLVTSEERPSWHWTLAQLALSLLAGIIGGERDGPTIWWLVASRAGQPIARAEFRSRKGAEEARRAVAAPGDALNWDDAAWVSRLAEVEATAP
jgi:hypothetical protein